MSEQRDLQDREMPGERERILYGLSKRTDSDIARLVKNAADTLEGLRALTKIFPEESMPAKKAVICGRCKKECDPWIPSDDVCREEHPYSKCSTEWDKSKKSWDHCRRCGKDFNLDGYHSLGKRGRNDPKDEGPFCYETKLLMYLRMRVLVELDNSDY
ncbi:hypothetical protein ACHAWO_008864 [Cyclotella atomus]|jgi:hypothetical protein|uniref:Uncharacterized protein n=1 Tax=Cyclotella atomus TaxID=382360 RepID=A0ABD3QTQ5_9STRA